MTQSRKTTINMPQETTVLQKSVQRTQYTTGLPILHRGVTSYQIFSDGKFIFKITATCETLTRYKFYNEGITNTVEEAVTYKRVWDNSLIFELSKAKHCLKTGHYERLTNGTRYDIYALYSSIKYLKGIPRFTGFKGYRVVPRYGFLHQSADTLWPLDGFYFVYEPTGEGNLDGR